MSDNEGEIDGCIATDFGTIQGNGELPRVEQDRLRRLAEEKRAKEAAELRERIKE